jgi:predicted dehydrogenase
VHCEKPIALNATEAQKIVDAKNRYQKKLMVALNNRFTNESYFVKKYAQAGLFGEIYHANCGWRRVRGIPGKGSWFTNKKLSGGGPLIDLGVHFIDLAMFFMGNPKPLSVSASTYSKFAENNSKNSWTYGSIGKGIYDVEDFAAGMIRVEGGATIDFEFSWASNIDKEYNYYELLGTKGGASFKDGKLKIFSELFDTCVTITPQTDYPINALNEFTHFVQCIKEDKVSISPPEHAVDLMRVIDAAYESALLNREVMLNNIREGVRI